MERDPTAKLNTGSFEKPDHPDHDEIDADGGDADESDDEEHWEPMVLETVAKSGEGVDELIATLDDHSAWMDETGRREAKARQRYAAEIRQLLRADAADLIDEELDRRGGIEAMAERVQARETDPYTVADDVLGPIEDCVDQQRE